MSEPDEGNVSNVSVYCRLRPPVGACEEECIANEGPAVRITDGRSTVCVRRDAYDCSEKGYPVTLAFDPQATQGDVFSEVGQPAVNAAFEGRRSTIIAYGQTGGGKTHTLTGSVGEVGLLPRALRAVFDRCEADSEHWTHRVVVQAAQVYNETLQDLLGPCPDSGEGLAIREDADGTVFVPGLRHAVVESADEAESVLETATSARHTALTVMNAESSRSHACYFVRVHRRPAGAEDTEPGLIGQVTVVDLAGSERIKKTNSRGVRREETRHINLSLTMLGNVVHALADPNSQHVPYRDSKLTRLLQESLGGVGRTSIVLAVGPCLGNASETHTAMQFGQRAMLVTQRDVVQREVDYRALCGQLKRALASKDRQLQQARARIAELESGGRSADFEAASESLRNAEEGVAAHLRALDRPPADDCSSQASDRCGLEADLADAREAMQELQRELSVWKRRAAEADAHRAAAGALRGEVTACRRRVEEAEADRAAAAALREEVSAWRRRAEEAEADLVGARGEMAVLESRAAVQSPVHLPHVSCDNCEELRVDAGRLRASLKAAQLDLQLAELRIQAPTLCVADVPASADAGTATAPAPALRDAGCMTLPDPDQRPSAFERMLARMAREVECAGEAGAQRLYEMVDEAVKGGEVGGDARCKDAPYDGAAEAAAAGKAGAGQAESVTVIATFWKELVLRMSEVHSHVSSRSVPAAAARHWEAARSLVSKPSVHEGTWPAAPADGGTGAMGFSGVVFGVARSMVSDAREQTKRLLHESASLAKELLAVIQCMCVEPSALAEQLSAAQAELRGSKRCLAELQTAFWKSQETDARVSAARALQRAFRLRYRRKRAESSARHVETERELRSELRQSDASLNAALAELQKANSDGRLAGALTGRVLIGLANAQIENVFHVSRRHLLPPDKHRSNSRGKHRYQQLAEPRRTAGGLVLPSAKKKRETCCLPLGRRM
eukprot:TRINITY_DN6925_c2_g1_i1.p1 TRINITY_DN6925_c2_g1~~TRINITY_DN6925_c2_g1_i1.p1  ORF type:complete len:963 (+),score=312.02 TRINITY_DN6925_c2_g1_i1:77-2965(+)